MLYFAGQDIQQHWQMKREMLPLAVPHYTLIFLGAMSAAGYPGPRCAKRGPC